MADETNIDISPEDSALLSKIQEFDQFGQESQDEWKSSREEGRAVWEQRFVNKPPKNSMYYPIVYNMLRPHVRAARRTYFSTPELISVLPDGQYATPVEDAISKAQREEMNYGLRRWNNMLAFIDDTFIQAEKIGVCAGKIRWHRTTFTQEVNGGPPTFEYDDNNELVEVPGKAMKEFIDENHFEISYIKLEDLLFDPTALVWDKVRWCIQKNIEYTEYELWNMVDSDGWDESMVRAFIGSEAKEEGKPPETKIYKVAEFWGWVQEKDGDKKAKFMKICMDNDYQFPLYKGTDVYKYIPERQGGEGKPMMPYQLGYLIRDEGKVIGESYCVKNRHLQGEGNCIRNQRRKSVENDLNERYAMDKNSDVEFVKFGGGDHGTIVMMEGLRDNFREINHKDNTGSSYGELAEVNADLERGTGSTPYVFGQVDPHMTDTLGGIQLMSTASQAIVYDNILGYNESFIEPLLTKALHLSIQFTPMQELEMAGVDLGGVAREDMERPFRLRVDTGMGATSELVQLNNLTKAYFTSMQWVDYCNKEGMEPGDGRHLPLELLRQMLPLLNVKNFKLLPTAEQVQQQTEELLKQMQQQQAAQQQQAQGEQGFAAQEADQAGFAAGQEQLTAGAGVGGVAQ